LMHELRGEPELVLEEALAKLGPCDLALVEGYKAYPIPKLEIWRGSVGKSLLYPKDRNILAIATDSPAGLPPGTDRRLAILQLSDVDAVATFVIANATAKPFAD